MLEKIPLFKTEDRIAREEAEIHKLQLQRTQLNAYIASLAQHGKHNAQQIDPHFITLLAKNQQTISTMLSRRPPQSMDSWTSTRWTEWNASDTGTESTIRLGDMSEQERNAVAVPAYIPFIGANKTIIIRSKETGSQRLELLQSLIVRTAMMLPHQARYTLLDPAGNGLAFPMRRYLPQVREGSSDVRRDLEQVIGDIQRIIETYLDASTTSFELVKPEIRVNERFQFVFAADFPNQYDRRAIEALQSIGNTGTPGGVYLFIHYNTNYELPNDMNMNAFRNAFYVDLTAPIISSQGLRLQPDAAPSPEVQSKVFEALRLAKPPERLIDWESIVGLKESEWWQETTNQIIETPIGLRGGGEDLRVWFGVKDQQPCAHGILGAMTGSGKSNLYHVLINGLALRYSPKELSFYLIDGKDGVEFQPYRRLPHAAVVSLRSSAELSRSVLTELLDEKERRNRIFSEVGVADLTGYRRKGQPRGNLPRILLLIDEYQELFDGDRDGVASACLLELSQQGRSAGIHMLLASQRFGAAGMLHQPAIFGNIHLRMAMNMTDADVQALSEFGRRGKALIATCDLPGKIVANDRSGDDAANQVGKVAYLQEERRNDLLQSLANKANIIADRPRTVVFDGKAQPQLFENPYFKNLLQLQTWPTPQIMETYARKTSEMGGLDIADWFEAEHPRVFWLGQEFNVHGQAKVILRRRVAENTMIIGATNPPRYGMLAAALAGLSVSSTPENTQFVIVDRCIPGNQWSDTLHTICDTLLKPAGFSTYYTNESNLVDAVLDDMLVELRLRQQLPEEKLLQLPSIFVFTAELDRVDRLRRKADAYGLTDSPSGEKLRVLLSEGSSSGIHCIMSFSSVRAMTNVVDERSGLINFRHRVALQMGEDESFTFVRSRKAAQLQAEGPLPICALYMDVESDKATRFKPYSTEKSILATSPQDTLVEQLQRVGKILAQRGVTQQ